MEFDSSIWEIVIDDLWESELPLDREMKRECVHLSGDVWFEYRPSIDGEQMKKDAEEICQLLQEGYPASVEISYSLRERLGR